MTDTSGPTSPQPFAFYDPAGSCWRTSQGTFPWDSGTFSGTWPRRGSMRSGACYEHPTWEPPTNAPASSSLLPTPTARDHKGRNQRDDETCLPGAVNLLPTPTVNDSRGGRNLTANRRPGGSENVQLGMTLTDWAWLKAHEEDE